MRKTQAMRGTTAFSFLICLALTGCQSPPVEKDPALTGNWLLLQINRGGKDIDLDHFEGAVREIRAQTYRLKPLKGTIVTGKYTVDPEAEPRTIDMLVDNGRFGGKTLRGIYRTEGDKLTISFGGPDGDRPAAFVSKPGTEYTVAIHKKLD